MRILRWIVIALLIWGLFAGIGYALAPLLTDGWGSTRSVVAGIALILGCGIGLLRIPRRI
jgi:hypothetical protein